MSESRDSPGRFNYGTFTVSSRGLRSPADLGDRGLRALASVSATQATVAGPFTDGMMALRDAILAGDRREEVLRTYLYGFARLRDLPAGWNVAEAIRICLASGFVLAQEAIHPTLLVLRQDPAFAASFRAAEADQEAEVMKLLDSGELVTALVVPLLLLLLKSTVVAGAELEFILSTTRRFLLRSALNGPLSERAVRLCASLAAQCFLTEYVYYADSEELAWAESLVSRVDTRVRGGEDPEPYELMLLACYASIARYPWPSGRFAALASRSAELTSLISQQVDEPRREMEMEGEIETLAKAVDSTSQRVRAMYEENPYPRWTVPIRKPTAPAPETFRKRYPNADYTMLDEITTPEILVAGCGTGLNIFSAIAGYQKWQTTAIDLSRRSLAYAAARIRALQVPDVRLMEGDILALKGHSLSFDIIECIGVLHHLADPLQGWRILVERLRPGGIMQVGLYSRHARRGQQAIRQFAMRRGFEPSHQGIVTFRHELLATIRDKSQPENRQLNDPTILGSPDFYSVSGCRDLIFHPQETSLTLPELNGWIGELGLDFLGFTSPGAAWAHAYQARFPDDPAGVNLSHWAELENEYPTMFARMYVFGVQKPPHR